MALQRPARRCHPAPPRDEPPEDGAGSLASQLQRRVHVTVEGGQQQAVLLRDGRMPRFPGRHRLPGPVDLSREGVQIGQIHVGQREVRAADGGDLVRVTERAGGHSGRLSPDDERLAVVFGDNVQLPDLFVGTLRVRARVTVSGNDAFFDHPLVAPEIVSFDHPDGGPLWAALFGPEEPAAEHPAVLHIHGGGYRQFAHRGWSVYGWALHLGLVNYLVQQGYTVLDFDYRGSAGYGRGYRTDIAGAMGMSDVDVDAAAARWLADEHGVDPGRIGIYGVSYGGFMTLMAQFRYPGVFAAGIARAPVTDWAHYNDPWTSRILGLPHENPEAYRRSSPIHHADGLRTPCSSPTDWWTTTSTSRTPPGWCSASSSWSRTSR